MCQERCSQSIWNFTKDFFTNKWKSKLVHCVFVSGCLVKLLRIKSKNLKSSNGCSFHSGLNFTFTSSWAISSRWLLSRWAARVRIRPRSKALHWNKKKFNSKFIEFFKSGLKLKQNKIKQQSKQMTLISKVSFGHWNLNAPTLGTLQ